MQPTGGPSQHSYALAPDLILVGGVPGFALDNPPDFVAWSKSQLYAWSRAAFPELRLNVRWGKARLVNLIQAYLATPQAWPLPGPTCLVPRPPCRWKLGAEPARTRTNPQVALYWYSPSPRVGYPPMVCRNEFCNINFNVDISPAGGWINGRTVPAGFGWGATRPEPGAAAQGSGLDPALVEAIPYIYGSAGAPYNPFPGNMSYANTLDNLNRCAPPARPPRPLCLPGFALSGKMRRAAAPLPWRHAARRADLAARRTAAGRRGTMCATTGQETISAAGKPR